MKKYETEVLERWGDTEAYLEYAQKTKNNTPKDQEQINNGLMAVFSEFAECKKSGAAVGCVKAQELVGKLQEYICVNYYSCTKEILMCLGQMYIADERFKKNIDAYGKGTAEFVSEAIKLFCN